MGGVVRLQYVNRDHSHPLYGKEGTKLAQGGRPGRSPVNCLVLVDGVGCVIAPYGNWRKVKP
jgi:hypothetical protein